MDPAEVLRDSERDLATRFGVSHPPHALSGEDLDCSDPRDARHWVGVYTELFDFVHGLLDLSCPEDLDESPPSPDQLPDNVRAMMLQVRVLQLHLAYWTDRLRRLSGDS